VGKKRVPGALSGEKPAPKGGRGALSKKKSGGGFKKSGKEKKYLLREGRKEG